MVFYTEILEDGARKIALEKRSMMAFGGFLTVVYKGGCKKGVAFSVERNLVYQITLELDMRVV